MSTFDFKKIGLDRVSTSIGKAISSGNGNGGVTVGDISKGELVTYQTSGLTEEEIPIRTRSTGIFPVTVYYTDGSSHDVNWKHDPDNNVILVKCGSATTCDFTFWVW